MNSHLSERGSELAKPSSSLLLRSFAAVAAQPDKILNFGTAENKLVWDWVQPRLAAAGESLAIGHTSYQSRVGSHAFREAFAPVIAAVTGADEVDPAHLAASAGVSGIIDAVCSCVCDPGDAVLIPSPYYGGFHLDCELHAQCKIYPCPCVEENEFAITAECLEIGWNAAIADGRRVRMVILTLPGNPTGTHYGKDTLQAVANWCEQHQVHLLSDEVYALSVYSEDFPFCSMWQCDFSPEYRQHCLHIAYGTSKDFGLAGHRCGLLYSHNASLLTAMGAHMFFAQCSSLVQFSLTSVLQDGQWQESMVPLLRHRLRWRAKASTALLDAAGIRYITPTAGLFVFAKLMPICESPEAEVALHEFLLESGVYIPPGTAGFKCPVNGWFRILYSFDWPVLREGWRRILSVVLDDTALMESALAAFDVVASQDAA